MLNRHLVFLVGITLAGLVASGPASAATYLFQLSGSRDAMFTIDTDIAPNYKSSSFIGDQISYNDVAGSFGGTTGTATVSFGTFLIATLNILGTSQGFTQFQGPDLFTLAGSVPTFSTGTFDLTSIGSGSSTLQISSTTASVPETASWAMFIGGFGLIGATMRRRKSIVSFG